MFADQVLEKAEIRARRVGASAARIIVAGVLAIVASGFLTASFWLFLHSHFGGVIASLSTAIIYGFLAFILLMIQPRQVRTEPTPNVGIDDLIQTFVMASQLGRSARR